jgi:carbonic anhydrase/acetyltransferase-like protein (isoleucine patch superfamily)
MVMIRELGGKRPRIDTSAFVSEAAYVVGDIEIGENSSIWPGAVLRADRFSIRIERNSNIQDHCVIHSGFSDLSIGDNVTIGHGAMIHSAKIGNHVLIGMHTVLDRLSEVGDFCIIGAYSMVKDNFKIPERSLAVGIPVKIIRPLNTEEIERILSASSTYVELGKEFKEQGL